MAVDYLGLVRLRGGRCSPDSFCHASRRNASCMAKAFHRHGVFLGALGTRDITRNSLRSSLSTGSMEITTHMVHPFGGFLDRKSMLHRLDDLAANSV